MTVLIGHPSGNPNSHHAALAHLESGRLEAFCVPWMPTSKELAVLRHLPVAGRYAERLARRRFAPLARAELVQGRWGEWIRMARRVGGIDGGEDVSYEANDWLMRTMTRECRRPAVTAVHAYEDCALWQFQEARRRGQACVYDLPIGYYPAWEQTQARLAEQFAEWLPASAPVTARRPQQKRAEMALADRVLAPSTFVARTVHEFAEKKKVTHLAPYGVDTEFWRPRSDARRPGPRRFIFAGQLGLRKGTPLLVQAWRAAALANCELHLVGSWQLAASRRAALAGNVFVHPPMSAPALRERLQQADAFVFPSYFEGFGLVLLEAMACGLPCIATDSTAGPDVLTPRCGRVVPAGNFDALVAALREFADLGDGLATMGEAARARAQECTWAHYRACVRAACEGL